MEKSRILSLFVILLVAVLGLSVYVFFGSKDTEQDTPASFPVGTLPQSAEEPVSGNQELYVVGASGNRVSTVGLVEHPTAVELSQGFYQISTDPERYDIFYNDSNNIIFISLYAEPLTFTRSLAEELLRATLAVDESVLCDLGIPVRTNEYVNERYAAYNLGLSFCPDSLSIDNI